MLSPDLPYPIEKTTKAVVFLKNLIQNPNITVGDYTYFDGRDRPETFETENVIFGRTSKLVIGKFCQIAYGTKFFLSDCNHQMSGFSTFPFFIFGMLSESCPEWGSYSVQLPDKGETLVGHDVWFGHESVVMPGVEIGSGAIVAARSVVTKDVAPYSIVAGNPAHVVRMRFPDEVIAQLLKIEWWNWNYEKITRHLSKIVGGDIQALLEVS